MRRQIRFIAKIELLLLQFKKSLHSIHVLNGLIDYIAEMVNYMNDVR